MKFTFSAFYYYISRRVTDLSEGRIRIGPGTLYTLLGRFKEQQIILDISTQYRIL